MKIKLATWNVNSIRAREESVLRWLRAESPDVLCIQETKVEDRLFPEDGFANLGYHVVSNGRKAWNGVAVISGPEPEVVAESLPDGFLEDQKRLLAVKFPWATVLNVYVPNGGSVESDRFGDKLAFLERLADYASMLAGKGPLIVMGDFNVAPGPEDVYDPQLLDGSVCFHPEERKRLDDFFSRGFVDAYRMFNPGGKAYSWWDYRAAAFRRNMGMRLDLVLLDPRAASMAADCRIHVEPRKWKRPSDHVPVVLELEIP